MKSAQISAYHKQVQFSVWRLGLVDYIQIFDAMRAFTHSREANTPDVLWLCQHPAVYTQGLAGKTEHLLQPSAIPVIQTDRGGQITYHGPGQIVAYPLLDLRRLGYFVKEYVYRLEDAVIRTLSHLNITGHRVRSAPGIYVRVHEPANHARLHLEARDLAYAQGLAKVAALGIKVSQRGCYHGLSLNVAMDLTPFSAINPCGYSGLKAIDLRSLGLSATLEEVQTLLARELQLRLQP